MPSINGSYHNDSYSTLDIDVDYSNYKPEFDVWKTTGGYDLDDAYYEATLNGNHIDLFDDFLLDKGRLIDNKLFTYYFNSNFIIFSWIFYLSKKI